VRWTGLLRGHFEFGTMSLSKPSLLLVRNSESRWNLERWLPPAKGNPAPSAPVHGPPSPVAPVNRLERIEFDEGRINFKTSKEGELRAYGRLETLNATYFAYGQRLQVDPGILIFDGPLDNPALQITAWRRNQAVEAEIVSTPFYKRAKTA